MNHFIVETKFGKLAVTPTNRDHVYVTTNPGGGRLDQLLPWVVNGKEHKFITAHLYRWQDGRFHVGQNESGADGLYATSLSAAAKKRVIPAIEDVVNQTDIDFPDRFDSAELGSIDTLLDRLKAKREELAAESRKVTDDIADLVHKRELLRQTRRLTNPD